MAICTYVKGTPLSEEPGDLTHPPCATCQGSPFAYQHVEDDAATHELMAGDLGESTETH